MQGHGAYGELTKSYVEGIIGVVSAMVNSVEMVDDPNRKIWFIADEFPQMGKVPVRPLFEVGRSRGLRCVVACQDFAQLEEIHGASMVKALIGMCGTLIVGQIMQGETAEQLCKAFGAREVERANTSSSSASGGAGTGGSTTLSFNRDEVPLYKPSELTSRLGLTEDGLGVIMMLFTGGHAYELRWPIFHMRKVRAPHKPAPWTLGAGMDWTEPARIAPPSLPMHAETQLGKDAALESVEDATRIDLADDIPVDVLDASPGGLERAEHMAVGFSGSEPINGRPTGQEAPAAPRLRDDAAADGARSPKEEIVVQVVADSTPTSGQEHCVEPLFDATAELAAIRLGLGPMGLVVEIASALDAAAQAPNAPKQRVHMGQARRGATPTGRHMP